MKSRLVLGLLACALAAYACRRGQSALYLRVPRLAEELAARFAAARQRGDTTHEKEESRFVLALQEAFDKRGAVIAFLLAMHQILDQFVTMQQLLHLGKSLLRVFRI